MWIARRLKDGMSKNEQPQSTTKPQNQPPARIAEPSLDFDVVFERRELLADEVQEGRWYD
jgi:hypothetical protein